ncbi:hypothetical protein CKM354_000610200 [Cercospora kikuchii]|uniref:Uncharacterized protein n=1 Tax=Cercospora kikuchii TaxID=84275 RepID=A0A9P3CEK0_9PEZI|nr:uncharacterized protein CKM354_000610200 [Cercospora kikuchii]GIZ42849.1 hypothetical protein CKM354_000610200 [Cercospora kikuchii]
MSQQTFFNFCTHLSSTVPSQIATDDIDARTYQEVKKKLEARREARRAKLERAELEAADELAEIERLEEINQTRAPSGLFERLPQDLRDQIWRYCVAPGKIFFSKTKIQHDTRFKDFDDYDKPHYPLLAKSNDLRPHYYGFRHPLGGSDDEDDIRLNSFGQRYLRSASFTFDFRSPTIQDALTDAADLRRVHAAHPPDPPWSSLTEEERASTAHYPGVQRAYEHAQGLMEALIWRSEGLQSIELNLANCYCQSGCCRAVTNAINMIFETGRYRWPDHVRVLGTNNRKERDYVYETVGCRYVSEGNNEIVFEKFEAGEEMVDPPRAGHKYGGYLIKDDLDVELEREVFKE